MSQATAIPTDVVLDLLAEASDACAVVDRHTQEVVWANAAWRMFDAAMRVFRTAPDDSPILAGHAELAALVAEPTDLATRRFLTWDAAGQPAFEASVSVHPFADGERQLAAVMILGPRPALDFPDPADPSIHRDTLTGLPGRAAMLQRIEHLEGLPPNERPGVALMFIDLNGFKRVNDRWGHLVGDQVLADMSVRLAGAIRTSDLIARYGGDEFVVLVEGFDEPEQIAALADRLRQAAEEPIAVGSHQLRLSASVGVATSSEGGSSLHDLLAEADRRMYAEKHVAS